MIHYRLIEIYTCIWWFLVLSLSVSFAASDVGTRMPPVLECSTDSDQPEVMFNFVGRSFRRAIK